MTSSPPPTTGPHVNFGSESGGATAVGPPALTLALSRGEVSIEAVLRRDATVRDFVAGHFDELRTAPLDHSAGLSQRLRRTLRGILRMCNRGASITRQGLQTTEGRGWGTESFGNDPDPQRLTITYYYPWGYFHPIRSGAAAVASRHLDYFRERGHRVRMLVRATPNQGRSAFERHYYWVADLAVVDVGKYPDVQRSFDTWGFGNYLAAHARLAEQPEIREWLSQPADVAFLNYVFATPLLDALPAYAYRVLETYDIMSQQFLEHRGSSVLLQQSLACEFDLYRLYDSVLMINREEKQFARVRCKAPLTYMPPSVDVIPQGSESGREEYDLLFVGSDHPPNVEGVNWFYHHVYRPQLKAKGICWAICGSVCRQLKFNDASVERLGSVADLGEVYRRSKVVVVPLFRGSGISIKTLEAMGQGKPVVTTPCGRRGLPSWADDALVTCPFDVDPVAVAGAICRLCSSEALRQDYGRRAANFVSDHFSSRWYATRMDRIFRRVAAKRRGADCERQNRTERVLPALRAAV